MNIIPTTSDSDRAPLGRRPLLIPPIALLASAAFLAGGELLSGTNAYFVAMMLVAILSIGITYNTLGGMRTFGGIIFAGFAARTIVISQIAKVMLLQAADKNLEQPDLTISIYAVFYFCAMVGVFVLGRVRLPLPRPAEPETASDYHLYYWTSLILGLTGTMIFEYYNVTYGSDNTVYNSSRSLGLALAPLLSFAMVIAIEQRIKATGGRHSVALRFVVPALVLFACGAIDTVRTQMASPLIAYIVVSYLRGYKFRLRHYAAFAAALALFAFVISPFALADRGVAAGQSFTNRALIARQALENPTAVKADNGEEFVGGREDYFKIPGTSLISRFSLIRADSTIVTAAAKGARYGFIPVKLAFSIMIPRALDKNKVTYTNPQDYIGHFAGMAPEGEINTYTQFSAVGDSYGAFGWLGVVLFPLLVVPLIFVVYDSIFDAARPWGTVVLAGAFLNLSEMMVHRAVSAILRDPWIPIALSYVLFAALRVVPKIGDHRLQNTQAEVLRG